MNDNKPRRHAVIVYFDLPDNCNPVEIRDWIKARITGELIHIDTWKGHLDEANFHIDLINTHR